MQSAKDQENLHCNIKIGINTAEVFAGSIGTDERLEF